MIHSRREPTIVNCPSGDDNQGVLFDQVVRVPCGCWLSIGSHIRTPVSSVGCVGTSSPVKLYTQPGLLLKSISTGQASQIAAALMKDDPRLDLRSTNLVIDTKRALKEYAESLETKKVRLCKEFDARSNASLQAVMREPCILNCFIPNARDPL